MKKITGFVCLMISFISLNAQGLKVTGDLKNLPDNTEVTLMNGVTSQEVAKGVSKNGNFILSGKTESATVFILGFKGMKQQIPLFIGNDNITVNGDLTEATTLKFSGSVSHDIYQDYIAVLTPLIDPYLKSMQANQVETNAVKKDSLTKLSNELGTNVTNAFLKLTNKYNESPVSTLFLLQFANMFPVIKDGLPSIYASFSGDAKKGPFADILDKTVSSAELGKIGTVLPEFKQNDATGKSVSLSSFRGKYVLIDFWASWCGPCRRENPNVIKTYARFKDKGFEIYGVSLDQDKSAWLKAIEADKLVWKHVSDLQYWNSVAAQAYQVSAIPMTFLLDKEGKVIAKGLRGEALDQFLTNLFSGK